MNHIAGLCPPAFLFVVYMTIQIVIDALQGFYNTSFTKIIILFFFGTILNLLCENDMTFIAWILIFVPFVLLSLMVAILLYSMKLKETSGNIDVQKDPEESIPPVIVLPNKKTITPVSEGCILIKKTQPPKHGMVTKEYTQLYCPIL